MTQEEKELLLKDLCARLPYGVIIQEYNEEYGYADNALNAISMEYFSIHEACIEGTWINRIENVRPYLRPMSSMTKEEKEKVYLISQEGNIEYQYGMFYRCQDYLNSIHVDFRGLIEKGLAIEAPEGMYETK